MQREGKSSQEIIVQLWDRVLVLPQGIHRTIFEVFCRTKTHHKWKMLTTYEALFIPENPSLITLRTSSGEAY